MSAPVSQYLRIVMPEASAGLSMRARLLLEVLGHYANRDGQAWCSVTTLAARMGVHPTTVRKARAEAVRAGLIAVDLSAGGRPGATNVYRFPVTAAVHTPRQSAWGEDPRPHAQRRTTPRPAAHNPTPCGVPKYQEGSIEAARYPAASEVGALWRAAAAAEREANMRAIGGAGG